MLTAHLAGLGRYGDALNPWADLQALARAWYVLPLGACRSGATLAARECV
jgi:hypothetical protein